MLFGDVREGSKVIYLGMWKKGGGSKVIYLGMWEKGGGSKVTYMGIWFWFRFLNGVICDISGFHFQDIILRWLFILSLIFYYFLISCSRVQLLSLPFPYFFFFFYQLFAFAHIFSVLWCYFVFPLPLSLH